MNSTCLLSRTAVKTAICIFALLSPSQLFCVSDPPPPVPQEDATLEVINDSDLPETYPQALYEVQFRAHGGVPSLHWRLKEGAFAPGMKLEDYGLLHGSPERTGEFRFTLAVTDSGKPQLAVEKSFVLRVHSALTLNWRSAAHVSGNRIEGTVVVSNTTPDNVALTFRVLAVAANGRATAIGFQSLVLPRGTLDKELPFGETLPRGGYLVHVDAVGAVAPKNVIYHEQLETPSPLQVQVGP
ncbi:MAG TPA: hypothetical protein VKV39_19220 [Candidatus Sulfotelmatobacter sp.]|nr:hypothetical protein [Candidatus Sulfotelmatobacter sp.]